MTVDAPTRRADPGTTGPATVGWAHVVVLAVVVVGVLVLYACGVLLPYYVNDLHRLPVTVVADGAHDPADLWPRNGWAGLLQAAGLAAVVFGPAVALIATGLGGAWLASLWRRPSVGRTAMMVVLGVLVVGSAAALAFLLSDTGVALKDWRLD